MGAAPEVASRFLTALAQAVSAMTLYDASHPAVVRAMDVAYDQLFALQSVEPRPVLTFLGDEVVYNRKPLQGLRSWEWGPRLAEVGVQRLEFDGPASRADFDDFVGALFARLGETSIDDADVHALGTIRFGAVGIRKEGSNGATMELVGEAVTGALGYTLAEEVDTMKYINDEARSRGQLHMHEVDTIVRSLAVAMHADSEFMIPLVHLKGYDQYTTTHSMNISVLSMALAEFVGVADRDVRRIGVAGLLHDIGKTRVPKEVLNKAGKLEDHEFEAIKRHPIEGAKILIDREANLDLAAVVAYEHHIRYDGGGYPVQTYKRRCHPASDLVHVCDVYDALRTHRPYRKAWTQERVLGYIEEQLGQEFEPELGRAFLAMMRRWGSKLFRITSTEDAVPIGESDAPDAPPTRNGEAPQRAPTEVPEAVGRAKARAGAPS